MAINIIMPSGGQTTDESIIVKWHKKVGDVVKRGDILFEIETDKTTMEVESYAEGYILAINFGEGEFVTSGETVALVGDKSEEAPGESEKSKLASPAARRLAKEKNINLGEITMPISIQPFKKKDIEEYIKSSSPIVSDDYYYIETSSMRKIIAKHMTESVASVPQFYVTMEIDMTDVMKLRCNMNQEIRDVDAGISYNDILIKCVSKAIEKYPIINSTYGEDKIKVHRDVNFGLAVGLKNGLVVPVVMQTNKKSLADIAKENLRNIEKAKNGSLQTSEISGGTITLSSLGAYGVDNFTAIINHPESCILAVGSVIEKPVIANGKIIFRNMMNITASFDHRVIDGAVGASFLKEVKSLLENPKYLQEIGWI